MELDAKSVFGDEKPVTDLEATNYSLRCALAAQSAELAAANARIRELETAASQHAMVIASWKREELEWESERDALRERLERAVGFVRRYRNECPRGFHPHMIVQEVDDFLASLPQESASGK